MSLASRGFKITAGVALIGLGVWGTTYAMAPIHEGGAAITYGKAEAPLRSGKVKFHLWYPSEPGGREVTVGGNGVFHGTPAGRGAPAKAGQFPLVVISHGSGGNPTQYGWIAARLAEAGYTVALPKHPGSTSGNASAEAALRLWERPTDLSAVIDHIEANPESYPYVDTTSITALGFSSGGYSALALAGARSEPSRLNRFCDHGGRGMSDCAFLTATGIDLHQIDFTPAAKDMSDPRITFLVAIDPGTVETITTESLQSIDMPALVINLGEEETIPAPLYARTAAEQMPRATYEIVPDAIHFSFLAECKPKGAQILANEGEPDRLCDDAGGQSRAEIHDKVSALIIDFLDRRTGPDRMAKAPTPSE